MPARTAFAAGLLALLITGPASAQRPTPEQIDQQVQELKQKLPNLPDLLAALSDPPETAGGTVPLPEPLLTEPFEIGEAWYDPGRLEFAVVSMLAAKVKALFQLTGHSSWLVRVGRTMKEVAPSQP